MELAQAGARAEELGDDDADEAAADAELQPGEHQNGIADGSDTFQKIWLRVAPKLSHLDQARARRRRSPTSVLQ